MTGHLKDIYHHMLKIFELHQSHKMAYSKNCDEPIYMTVLFCPPSLGHDSWHCMNQDKDWVGKTVLIQISKSNIYLKVFICILSQIFYLSLYQMLQNQNRLICLGLR